MWAFRRAGALQTASVLRTESAWQAGVNEEGGTTQPVDEYSGYELERRGALRR